MQADISFDEELQRGGLGSCDVQRFLKLVACISCEIAGACTWCGSS